MNKNALEEEVEKLSSKLEKKIDTLSRDGIYKDSKSIDDEKNSEIYQLNRKTEISDSLNDILQSLLKTFSISPESTPGGRGERVSEKEIENESNSTTGEEETFSRTDEYDDNQLASKGENESGISDVKTDNSEDLQREKGDVQGENEGINEADDITESDSSGVDQNSAEKKDLIEKDITEDPGKNAPPLHEEEKEQSGEFDEDRIEGELNEGEEIKSFIRALPHMVDPTLNDLDIIYYYNKQLETAINKEQLPEGYESVIRDYFLSIGVLNE